MRTERNESGDIGCVPSEYEISENQSMFWQQLSEKR